MIRPVTGTPIQSSSGGRGEYGGARRPVISITASDRVNPENPRALHIATFFPNRIAAVTKPGTKLISATLWMPPNNKAMMAPQHHRAIMKAQVALRTCPRQRRPSDTSKTTATLLLSTALGTFGKRGTRPYHSPTHASETNTIGCNALAASCSVGLNALHDGIVGR